MASFVWMSETQEALARCSLMIDLALQLDVSEDVVTGDVPVEATFTYSVQWRETDIPYEKRMDKYRRYQFLPQHLEVGRKEACPLRRSHRSQCTPAAPWHCVPGGRYMPKFRKHCFVGL